MLAPAPVQAQLDSSEAVRKAGAASWLAKEMLAEWRRLVSDLAVLSNPGCELNTIVLEPDPESPPPSTAFCAPSVSTGVSALSTSCSWSATAMPLANTMSARMHDHL
eukprot:scaffold137108_cov35-Tisochrysis_lutea.AAC.2